MSLDTIVALGGVFFFFVWVLVILVERNRLPYDFLEGESELVSGFNTEYWGGYFSFFFIYEYGSMLFFSLLLGFIMVSGFFSFLIFIFMVFFFFMDSLYCSSFSLWLFDGFGLKEGFVFNDFYAFIFYYDVKS